MSARRTLAASFVLTTSSMAFGACSAKRDCAAIAPGSPCSGDDSCFIATRSQGCGVNGYACREGAWREQITYCNPPGESERVPPPPPSPSAPTATSTAPSPSGAPLASATLSAAAEDCSKTSEGAACDGAARCMITGKEHGCGLNGFQCRDGHWRKLMTYCNPPRQ